MHPTLARLDCLALALSTDPAVVGVVGLGSAGLDTDRFDDHSDIDFFVVVDDVHAKQRYVVDTNWLNGFGGRAVFEFAIDGNGRKALFDDGLFVEFAVFTPTELVSIPMARGRVVWERRPSSLDVARINAFDRSPAADTVEFHLNEALANLYVGLQREQRGEHLSAMRFIQVYAVDRVLALVRLGGQADTERRDIFDASRRIERAIDASELPLADLIPGYSANRSAAGAVLAWLTSRYETNPAIVDAIRQLLVDPE